MLKISLVSTSIRYNVSQNVSDTRGSNFKRLNVIKITVKKSPQKVEKLKEALDSVKNVPIFVYIVHRSSQFYGFSLNSFITHNVSMKAAKYQCTPWNFQRHSGAI